MKAEVISRETIKPSSPTPHHLRNVQLSRLDHLATSNYVSIILFFTSDGDGNDEVKQLNRSDQLKKSLSETLTIFYPVAGRIKDGVSVDCNDDGVDYLEAKVNGQLPEFLHKPDIDALDQFLPCETSVTQTESVPKAFLAIQVNVFDCGGMAIGICFSHKICDGASMATFINVWAAKARGGASEPIPHPCFDLASLFPPRDLPESNPPAGITRENIVTRRFIFDGTKIASLRAAEATTNTSRVVDPTRVEVVSAFIWRRVMAVVRPKPVPTRAYAALHAVNLRGRMVPPLPKHYFGNIVRPTVTPLMMVESEIECEDDLVGQLRDSIRKMDGDYVRKLQCGDEGFVKCIKEAREQFSKDEVVMLNFNSWCRFPFYEADFGWGEPKWVSTTKEPCKNLIILIDTRAGDGIEAWVNMLEEEMAELERDQDLLAFVSLN